MDYNRHLEIKRRWQEIDRELAENVDCKTHQLCAPLEREAELLIEQDALEFELRKD
jgi:hypothetical protein